MELYIGHKQNADAARKKALVRVAELKLQRIQEYDKNPRRCKHCDTPIEYKHKSTKKFCNSSCAASHNNTGRVLAEVAKSKQRESLQKNRYLRTNYNKRKPKICDMCKCVYQPKTHKQKFCSINCRKCFFKTEAGSNQLKAKMIKIIKEGKHKGWTHRRFEPSYPEKYFMNVLNNEQLEYIYEHKVGNFFIDFAFLDKMIALEIDGKQHKYEYYAKRDVIKDAFLNQEGWIVFRIDWFNPVNETNKEKLYKQIDNFKVLYYTD